MKKQIVAMITCLMMCTVFVLSGFTSNAQVGSGDTGMEFNVPYNRPQGDGVGYISLLLKKNGVYSLVTYYWSIQAYNSANASYENKMFGLVNVDNGEVLIELNNTSHDNYAVHCLGRYVEGSNDNQLLSIGLIFSQEWTTYTFDYTDYGYMVLGYEIGGNCILGSFVYENWNSFFTPTIRWGGDNSTELLNEIITLMSQNKLLLDTYLPKLNRMDLSLVRIYELLNEMQSSISEDEQQKIDQFEQDSGVQSDELSSLNQQTQVDKIDVDSASQTVDANLNIQTDANYGVLLSTFTSNDRILTMLLLVASVSLISFVLFGKR